MRLIAIASAVFALSLTTVIFGEPSQDGQQIFRYDTFGDEAFWGDTLRLHEAIAGSATGGVGPGVSPRTALAVGLKVDVDALPNDLVRKLQHRMELPLLEL